MKRVHTGLVFGLVMVLGACGDQGGAAADVWTPRPTAEEVYAPSLEVDLAGMRRTPSGLFVQDLAEGAGATAEPGKRVAVHYTGWLPNGREFDSSRGRAPIEFSLGAGQVITGWDEGVAGLREGGRRKLVIPPDLAYGERGAGGIIPPGATLVFDVELVAVR